MHSLALRLLGDVTDGGPLLADDGSNILCGYQEPQRDVSMWRFRRHSARGPTTGPSTRPITRAAAIVRPPLTSFQLRELVRDVGDTQGVVLKLVSIELLDSSDRKTLGTH